MIRGPVGERRLDAHLDWLRQALFASHGGNHTFEDCRLKYDWRRYFPKEDEEAIYAATVENMEKDIAFLESRFGGGKRQK